MCIENMAAIYVNSNAEGVDHGSVITATDDTESPYANFQMREKDEHLQSGCAQRSRTVAVCLGVLCFLAVIIGQQVYYSIRTVHYDSEMQRVRTQNKNLTEDNKQVQTSYDNLTEQFNTMYKILTADKVLLRKEVDGLKDRESILTGLHDSEMQGLRDQFNANTSNLTEQFNAMYKKLTADKVFLQKEVDCLNATANCPSGWKSFGCSCYLIVVDTVKTWAESRLYCQRKGADLVIVNSREEQDFLLNNQKQDQLAWIGLSDRASEGTWRWVDGTTLQGEGFWATGEPNDASEGGEDCVHIESRGWNDRVCTHGWLNWICEK